MNDSTSATTRQALGHRISALQHAHLTANSPRARATLSVLRRSVAKDPGRDPLAWGLVLDDGEWALPQHLLGHGDQPSRAEWAAYIALTCYALHQQSQTRPMHQPTVTFGQAMGRLVAATTPSVKARFDALMTASSFSSQRYHLRSLVTLLRSKDIGFDYGRFAADIEHLLAPRTRDRVLLRWGRDYARGLHTSSKASNASTGATPTTSA